ncbi:MAG: phosphoribosylformylglycinamidine cyclo-ligase [Phycisphaerae bacterium]|nr:phosphoribosylformylglycinamidine cyclo-ligase [Phycisphaerae bacterium]
MARKKKLTYRDAGVDVDANDLMVERIKPHVRSTFGPRVLGRYGSFAALFRLDSDEKRFPTNYREPVLVACTDGVGTKVLVAAAAGRLNTVGIDLVAMSVNDMLTCGAEPLFFLDYVAIHKLDPAEIEEIVSGIAEGCRQAGCSLIGGETAEQPDIYRPKEFDLAGFAVGIVERKRLADNAPIEPGDAVIGLPSDGIHSNGYSLVRRLVFDRARLKVDAHIDALGETVADALLRPTRIYVKPVLALLRHYQRKRVVRGMAHITGGGLTGNIPRMLPDNCRVVLKRKSWPVPKVFDWLESLGADPADMHGTFNMGIGYVMIVRRGFADGVIRQLHEAGQPALPIGVVRRGKPGVEMK